MLFPYVTSLCRKNAPDCVAAIMRPARMGQWRLSRIRNPRVGDVAITVSRDTAAISACCITLDAAMYQMVVAERVITLSHAGVHLARFTVDEDSSGFAPPVGASLELRAPDGSLLAGEWKVACSSSTLVRLTNGASFPRARLGFVSRSKELPAAFDTASLQLSLCSIALQVLTGHRMLNNTI